MGSVAGNPLIQLEGSAFKAFLSIQTDSNGDPTNTAAGTIFDQDGDALPWPKEVVSVVRSVTGLYTVTLKQDWYKIVGLPIWTVEVPLEQTQATVIGSVDLTGLTLSALNTLTLIVDGDVGAAETVTFTTPSSVADIVTQITAQVTAARAVASLVTSTTGAVYLKIVSPTRGASSTMLLTGTGRATLGMGDGTTTITGQTLGHFIPTGHNPKGHNVDLASRASRTLQTFQALYLDAAGTTETACKSANIGIELTLKRHAA